MNNKEFIPIPTRSWDEMRNVIFDLRSKIIEQTEMIRKLSGDLSKELLTPSEVCKVLKIGRTTYQRYVNTCIFEQIKIAGKVYVRRSDIERLIEEGKV